MNIVEVQSKLLNQLSSISVNLYDNTIEPIKEFPAVIVEPASESYYDHSLGPSPCKCRFQVFIADVIENNDRSISKTRQQVSEILSQISKIWTVSLDGNVEYSAVKIDGRNAILADFVVVRGE